MRVTGDREVTCSQTLGNLRQGAEPHVGEPVIAGDGPTDGDARDTGRHNDIDGCQRVTRPHLVEDSLDLWAQGDGDSRESRRHTASVSPSASPRRSVRHWLRTGVGHRANTG